MSEKEHIRKTTSRIFSEEGDEALSLRHVASEAGVTTMAIYKHFGGKEGLLQVLFEEGFDILRSAQRDVRQSSAARAEQRATTGDSGTEDIEKRSDAHAKDELIALCLRYREVALQYPAHYNLMTGTSYNAPPESRQKAFASFLYLVKAATEAFAYRAVQENRAAQENIATGKDKIASDAQNLAALLFVFCHGFVSLELAAMHPVPDTEREGAYKVQLAAIIDHALTASQKA